MTYINAIRKNNDVIVWERNNGIREIKIYRAPYYFYTKAPHGKHISIYGDKLEKHTFNTNKEFNLAKRKFSENGKELFESDIPPELKILSEKYYNKPAPKLHVTFFDIEVDYDKSIGHASIENPYAPINSIALYNNWQNRMVVYAIPPENYSGTRNKKEILNKLDEIAELPTYCKVEIYLVDNEEELLLCFLEEIKDSDVISGWNSEFFDVPYLGKRLLKFGNEYFRKLSFDEADPPKFREVEIMHRIQQTLDIYGRISADYMAIFKKYEVVERPTFKLEAIADEILVNPETKEPVLPKLEYEGSLADLYRNDFLWFIRYNLRDTEILKGFEDRLGYIELANQMCHLSTGLFKHVTGTIKLSELATINYCHHELGGLIVNDVHVPDEISKAKGAFVLLPQIGEHKWIGSVDINSLYPSAIRSINISPETIVGQFIENEKAFEEIRNNTKNNITLELNDTGEQITATAIEWKNALKENKWSISGYGTVFSQEKQGIMPSILEYWYSTRKKYQKLMKEAKANNDKEKATYYDKLQYVYKIKLNSYYGSLLNAYFRFYDKRLGESTTATSRIILLHQSAKVTELLDGEYAPTDRLEYDDDGKQHIGYSNKWSVIYGDTDSTYFKTYAKNKEEAIKIADAVGEATNASFPEFMRNTFLCNSGFDTIIKTGREIVSDKGIFVDKKRYFLHIVDDEGFEVDKIKVMGLDTKKTTLPKKISKTINKFVERYLKGEDWKKIEKEIVDFKDELYETDDIMLIGLPKGVKKVEFYTEKYNSDKKCGLPGHVAASIFYNICLEEFKDKESPKIISGMKIAVFYLDRNYGKFKSIAIPVDIEKIPEWFIKNFNIDRKAHIERLVDNPIDNIIKAIGKKSPSRQSLLNDELLGF